MLTDKEKEIVLSFARNDMCLKRTGKELYRHSTNVKYYFGKILRRTGLNPQKFYDLVVLVERIKAGAEE